MYRDISIYIYIYILDVKMGLKPHLYSITSVNSLPKISAIRLGPRPTNWVLYCVFEFWV